MPGTAKSVSGIEQKHHYSKWFRCGTKAEELCPSSGSQTLVCTGITWRTCQNNFSVLSPSPSFKFNRYITVSHFIHLSGGPFLLFGVYPLLNLFQTHHSTEASLNDTCQSPSSCQWSQYLPTVALDTLHPVSGFSSFELKVTALGSVVLISLSFSFSLPLLVVGIPCGTSMTVFIP